MASLPEIICMTAAMVLFILFFFPTRIKRYFAIAAWVALVAGLFTLLPELFAEGNFLYPILIVLSLLLLYVCIRRLLKDDPVMRKFTVMGGVFSIIFVPFLLFKPLADWLIGTVVFCIRWVFDLTGFEYYTADPSHPLASHFFNYFFSIDPSQVQFFFNGETEWVYHATGYSDMIILGCTGITAIALLVAIFVVSNASWIKKIVVSVAVSVIIYIVNVFRNVFVIRAYFGQWFPWGEDLIASVTGTAIPGYASFFWSHNVMCECGAFIVVIVIALILFKREPDLVGTLKDIVMAFITDIRDMFIQKRSRS